MPNYTKQQERSHHIIYQTTNLINGKIYIGAHSTDNIEDGYLGSGKNLKSAIAKYGSENFKREILYIFDSYQEMYLKEAELVNENFISRSDTYNIVTGGSGGPNKGSSGLRHVHNPRNGDHKAIPSNRIDEYLQDGWIRGSNKPGRSNTIWIHQNGEKKGVRENEVSKFLAQGWSKGLPKSPTSGQIWIYLKDEDRYSLCKSEDLEKRIAEGWIKKKWAGVPKGTKMMNKDGTNKRVKPHLINEFLADGWNLGKSKLK